MSQPRCYSASQSLSGVRYEIRGRLAAKAEALEAAGINVLKLNIGNPGRFGFRAPEALNDAIRANLQQSDAYAHQKGLIEARSALAEAAWTRYQIKLDPQHIFIGNGVSELIDLSLRALLNAGDEVLIPSPDYPLWTAAVTLNGGRAVSYPCRPEDGFVPDAAEIEALITPRTRALVLINPNNPTGAVYPLETLRAIAALADRYGLVLMSDEIYGDIGYDGAPFHPMASLLDSVPVLSYGGLSKVHRACGYRVGWLALSGALNNARSLIDGIELLSSLRLCSNVPTQWAIKPALKDFSIHTLTAPGGRLYETRAVLIAACAASQHLKLTAPRGAIYGFPQIDAGEGFDDEAFAYQLLEREHVLIVPGSSFNFAARDHFRITLLPEAAQMREVIARIDACVGAMVDGTALAA
jgi:alanine-synthesizing transaminase